MTDLSHLTDDELAEGLRDYIVEGERRLEADGTHPRALKALRLAHGALDIAVQHLSGPGGPIQTFSGGTPKG